MIKIFHIDKIAKVLKNQYFSTNVIKHILLDLYFIDSGRMWRRCRVDIVGLGEEDTDLNNTYTFYGSKIIDNYTRSIYYKNRYTNIILYQKNKEK